MNAETRKEIERRFLVTADAWKRGQRGTLYRQGYLSIDPDRTVRVRLEGEQAKLTIKGRKTGATAAEFEYPIPKDDAEALLEQLCLPNVVEKRRYHVEYGGFVWEVDEYLGENEGLRIAEIELESEDQSFDMPEWIGEEVTGDVRYANANLSHTPYQSWP